MRKINRQSKKKYFQFDHKIHEISRSSSLTRSLSMRLFYA